MNKIHLFVILIAIQEVSANETVANTLSLIQELNGQQGFLYNIIILDTEANGAEIVQQIIRELELPKIITTLPKRQLQLRKPPQWQLLWQHHAKPLVHQCFNNQKLMTIVLLDFRRDVQQIQDIVKNTLEHMHFTTTLWLCNNCGWSSLRKFCHQCWQNGYTKVLFYQMNYNQLFSCSFFPIVQIRRLKNAQEFLSLKRITNFYKHPLVFPIISYSPHCWRYTDAQGNRKVAGYFYKTLETFASKYNFRIIEYPYKYHSFNISAIFEALRTGAIDTVPSTMPTGTQYTRSRVAVNIKIEILAPFARPVRRLKYFILPFDRNVWLLIALFLTVATVCVSLIRYRLENKWDLSRSYLRVLSLLIYQSHTAVEPKFMTQKLLFVMFFVLGLVMTNIYLAKLSSVLIRVVYGPQINSIDDLIATNLPLLVSDLDMRYLAALSNLTERSPMLLKRLRLADAKTVHETRRALNTSHIYVDNEETLNFYLHQQKFMNVPLMHRLPFALAKYPSFFPLRHNLPYEELFNEFLALLSSSGIANKLFKQSYTEGIKSGEIHFISNDIFQRKKTLGFEYFLVPMYWQISNLLFAFVVFVMENMHYYWSKFVAK